jgi:diacylglycerol kinase family enzyme
MSQVDVLFNPISGAGSGQKDVEILQSFFRENLHYHDITRMNDFQEFFTKIAPEDAIVICGGDGTLNRFINSTYGIAYSNPVYYYPTGSGNDFFKDIGKKQVDGPILINDYIRNLPCVNINGKTYRFLNGVGYGIDGYCCEIGEQLRKRGKKPNYTAIAVKGLLFHYIPTDATVIVDGVEHHYRRVWIAPTMHGRYYGGGMMPAPNQQRLNDDGKLSVLVMHNSGKIGTLCVFPSIFQGRHLRYQKKVALHEGHDIIVRFDRPVTLQIDGEVILGVSEYRAYSKIAAKVR